VGVELPWRTDGLGKWDDTVNVTVVVGNMYSVRVKSRSMYADPIDRLAELGERPDETLSGRYARVLHRIL
jgi:hypothetical protein